MSYSMSLDVPWAFKRYKFDAIAHLYHYKCRKKTRRKRYSNIPTISITFNSKLWQYTPHISYINLSAVFVTCINVNNAWAAESFSKLIKLDWLKWGARHDQWPFKNTQPPSQFMLIPALPSDKSPRSPLLHACTWTPLENVMAIANNYALNAWPLGLGDSFHHFTIFYRNLLSSNLCKSLSLSWWVTSRQWGTVATAHAQKYGYSTMLYKHMIHIPSWRLICSVRSWKHPQFWSVEIACSHVQYQTPRSTAPVLQPVRALCRPAAELGFESARLWYFGGVIALP